MGFAGDQTGTLWTTTGTFVGDAERRREDAVRNAPGLTVRDIDHLLREAYADGHAAGRAEGYIDGRRDAEPHAAAKVSQHMRNEIKRVVGGQLIHIARRLNDRRGTKKTTLAAEREWAFREGE